MKPPTTSFAIPRARRPKPSNFHAPRSIPSAATSTSCAEPWKAKLFRRAARPNPTRHSPRKPQAQRRAVQAQAGADRRTHRRQRERVVARGVGKLASQVLAVAREQGTPLPDVAPFAPRQVAEQMPREHEIEEEPAFLSRNGGDSPQERPHRPSHSAPRACRICSQLSPTSWRALYPTKPRRRQKRRDRWRSSSPRARRGAAAAADAEPGAERAPEKPLGRISRQLALRLRIRVQQCP